MSQQLYFLYEIVYLPAIKAMNGNRGRMISQGGHGFLHAFFDALDRFPEAAAAYRAGTPYKITLQCDDEQYMLDLYARYQPICGVTIVEESGSKRNGEINENAKGFTGVGIGPIRQDLIDTDLSDLAAFR